jgi:hypothetical protein
MSYPRNMAGAVALVASVSLFGLGCAVGADEQDTDADEQTIVADDAIKGEEGSKDDNEATGESKDPIWGFGRGFGFGGYGRGFGFGGYGRGFGFGGYGRGFGFGYPGIGYGYPGIGYGYPVLGYPVYGYPYLGGGCGWGC